MSRRIDSRAVARILEAAFLLRSARLSTLASDGQTAPSSSQTSGHSAGTRSATDPATRSARGYLRESVLNAVEIGASSSRGSALTVAEESHLARKKDAAAVAERLWRPRKEIGTALEGRDLHLIDLSGARLSASFNRSNLSGAVLAGCYFAHCTFNSCVLRTADLSGGEFHSCTFMSTDAENVKACRAHFSHCTFHRANLCNWDASGATFFQCSFTMSDLSRWHVDGQTTVIKPADWGRCRRLSWRMAPRSGVRGCSVIGDSKTMHALSLGPPQQSACFPTSNTQ